MNEIIFQVVAIALASVWFAEMSTIPQYAAIWLRRKRAKPFDCPLCLAWWSGLIWFGLMGEGFSAIVFAACASAVAVWIAKKLNE